MTKLIIVSGSDRVGKSTFIKKLGTKFNWEGKSYVVKHFSVADPFDEPSIFSQYYTFLNSYNKDLDYIIWDRSYVCGYILNKIRDNTQRHHHEFITLEYDLSYEYNLEVKHIGIVPLWGEISRHHLKEVNNTYGELQKWYIVDTIEKRRLEHNKYNSLLKEVYKEITLYPSMVINHQPRVIDLDRAYVFINE